MIDTPFYGLTRDLRAVRFLLGRAKVECTVKYHAIEFDIAIALARQIDANPEGQADRLCPRPNGPF